MAPGTQTTKNGRRRRPYSVSTVGTPQASSSIIRPLKKRRRGKRVSRRAARRPSFDLQISCLCSLMSNLRISDGPRQDLAQRIVRLSAAAWQEKARGQLIPHLAVGKKKPMGVDHPALALAPSRIQLGKRGSGPGIPHPARKGKEHLEADPPQNAKRLRLDRTTLNNRRHRDGHRSDSSNGRHTYSHHSDRDNGGHRAGHRYDSNRRH